MIASVALASLIVYIIVRAGILNSADAAELSYKDLIGLMSVVSLTLVLTVVCAKVVGCTLPLAAEKIGIDPAVMAAPFITTVVDALSLLIYFAIATRILGI